MQSMALTTCMTLVTGATLTTCIDNHRAQNTHDTHNTTLITFMTVMTLVTIVGH